MIFPGANIGRLDWAGIASQLHHEGYVLLPNMLDAEVAHCLACLVETTSSVSVHHVSLASAGLGHGDLFRFGVSLPAPLNMWRAEFYRPLSSIANRWNETMGIDDRFPLELEDFLRRNRAVGQMREQSHLSRLGLEDHIFLHQHHDGEQLFPMQIVALLSKPGRDFLGGEFVMTERRPRMQSRTTVLPLNFGDVAIISTAARPFKGTKGYYQVSTKHAISRIREGERIGLELTFHYAL